MYIHTFDWCALEGVRNERTDGKAFLGNPTPLRNSIHFGQPCLIIQCLETFIVVWGGDKFEKDITENLDTEIIEFFTSLLKDNEPVSASGCFFIIVTIHKHKEISQPSWIGSFSRKRALSCPCHSYGMRHCGFSRNWI